MSARAQPLGARSADVCERLRRHEGSGMRTFTKAEPVVWARAAGSHVWDEDGRRYLDLDGGFAVATVGHCHPRVTDAIVRQAATMSHCPSAAPSAARAALYERLVGIAPPGLDFVLPAVTGSIASEVAIQLARAATGRQGVIGFAGTYVGRTVGSVPYAGKHAYRRRLGVPPADTQFLPFPDPYRSKWSGATPVGDAVLALLSEMLEDPASGVEPPACIVVEPVQGNGGVVIPPAGFLPGLRELADRVGAVLLFDEIQCGFGRTGRMWAAAHDGVVPDLMTIGKGIGGGMPLAAVLGRAGLLQEFEEDTVTSTFVGNAVNAAAATAAIDVLIEEELVPRSEALGTAALGRLSADLADAERVGNVRGRGLFIGIELVDGTDSGAPDPAAATAAAIDLQHRGMLVGVGGRHRNVIKLAPPLSIDEADLDEGLDAIVEVLR